MTVFTIPKEITKGEDLIVIPKKLYEQFLHLVEKPYHFSVGSKLDSGLLEALEDVKKKRITGPFSTIEEGLKVLKQTK